MASTQTEKRQPLFPLGRTVATPNALAILQAAGQTPFEFLARHEYGDWGECNEADARENDLALKEGSRIFSVYKTRTSEALWVITESDRSSTCVLAPSDY